MVSKLLISGVAKADEKLSELATIYSLADTSVLQQDSPDVRMGALKVGMVLAMHCVKCQ